MGDEVFHLETIGVVLRSTRFYEAKNFFVL